MNQMKFFSSNRGLSTFGDGIVSFESFESAPQICPTANITLKDLARGPAMLDKPVSFRALK